MISKLSPSAVLLATLLAIVGIVLAEEPTLIVGLGAPALLVVLLSALGRRTFARRLLLIAPLACVAVLLRWFEHAQGRALLSPALRVLGAVAWSSCLSTLLAPTAIRAALRGLGVPAAFVELIAHTRRFAVQLAATTSEAWSAATLRGGLLSLRATSGTVGHVAGVIVVRAFDRAECVAIAGALRGTHLANDAPQEQASASQKQGLVA